MVATLRQLYHSPTFETPLPAMVSRNTKKGGCRRVLGAVTLMRCVPADGASLSLAFDARGYLVLNELCGNKCRAARYVAVCSLGRAVFKFLGAILSQYVCWDKNLIDTIKRNGLAAASRGEYGLVAQCFINVV
jgi:hypothetical protein